MTKKDIRNKIKSELLLRDSNLKKFAKEKFNISYDGFMKKLNGSTKLSFKDVFVLVKSTSSKILDEVFEVLEQDRVVEEVAQAIEKQCIESSFMAQDLKLSEDQIKLLKQNLAKIFFTIMTKKKNDFLNDLKKELNKNGQDGVKIEDTFIFRIKQILAKTLSNTLDIIGEQFKREYSFQSTVDKVERIVDNKTGQNIGFRYQAVHYGKAVLAPNANLISFTTDIANCFEKGIMKGEVNENKKTPSAEKKVVDVTEEQIKNVVNSTVKEETKTNIDVTVVSWCLMSEGVYVKTFGAYGVAPAKIFPDKDGQFLTWKTVKKTKDNYTYNEQYCMFRLVTSIYDGKNKYGTAKYKNGNVIYVKIKDINLYNLLKSMEIKNAKFYNFYGSVVVSNYNSYTHIVKNEDGSIKKDKKGNNLVETLLRTEWCLLNDYNAKIIPFYDKETTPVTQNTELQESENINDEIKNDPYDDDIPF